MKKLIKEYVNQMHIYVLECLVNEYHIDKSYATQIVQKSSFSKLLQDSPEYVMHYNVEYWAERIKKESDKVLEYATI